MIAGVVAIACIIAAVIYFLFRSTPNQFPTEIGNMTPQDRADVLVSATIWRLRWETDNPQFVGIFLSPNLFSPEVCNRLFQMLMDTVVQLRQNKQGLDRQLSAMGVNDELPDADINGCRIWMGTIGTRSGQVKREDMLLVWKLLRDAIPFIDESMTALSERQETHRMLGRSTDLLLGLDPRRVVQEARHTPTL